MPSTSLRNELADLLRANCSTDEKLVRLLQTGCDHFGLMLGLISEIQGGAYHVVSAYPDGLVNIGDQFDLGETICDVTRSSSHVVSFSKASGTEWASHPAYDKFSLESYIGTTYSVEAIPKGTINFSSPTALGRSFTNDDETAIEELAKTLSTILS